MMNFQFVQYNTIRDNIPAADYYRIFGNFSLIISNLFEKRGNSLKSKNMKLKKNI